MAWNLHDVVIDGGNIVVRGEHWDGIDKRDWVRLAGTPPMARRIAAELVAAATKIEDAERDRRVDQLAVMKAKLAKLTLDIAEMEANVGGDHDATPVRRAKP